MGKLRIVHYSYYIFNTHKKKLKMHKIKFIIYHLTYMYIASISIIL
jgi:hypothetical protein